MIRWRPAVAALALIAGLASGQSYGDTAQAQDRDDARPASAPGPGAARNSYANPSAVIATEIAFAQLAQEKGQWTAFAAYAAVDGVMFAPGMVYAQAWLKGRANPASAVRWQTHEVWSSCDGSLMVSHGAWQGGKANGYFTTRWQRQKDGKYKWILDHGDALAQPQAAPDMLAGHVADCPERPRQPPGDRKDKPGKPPKEPKKKLADLPALDPLHRAGRSEDGSLVWDMTVTADGARKLTVNWTKDGQTQPAWVDRVPGAQ